MVNTLNQTMTDFEIKLVPLPWRQAKAKAGDGELPALLGAYYHGHDWDYLYPYSQPLLYEDVVLVCHKEKVAGNQLNWPEDFKGKLVSNISGYDGWLHNNVRSSHITELVNLIEVPDIATAWRMVNRKIVDCTLFEKRAMKAVQNDASGAIHIASLVTTESVHIGFSTNSSVKQKWPRLGNFKKQLDNAIYLSKAQRKRTLETHKSIADGVK